MKPYTQLTSDKRISLMLMQGRGLSLRSFSRHSSRHVSSLSRELLRMARSIAISQHPITLS